MRAWGLPSGLAAVAASQCSISVRARVTALLRLSLDRPDAGWRAGELTRYAAEVVAAGRAGPLLPPCNEPSQEHLQVAVLALVHRSVCAMAAAFAHIATALLTMAYTDRLSPTPDCK